MYTFIDADNRQVQIEKDKAHIALKNADDFRKLKIDENEHADFHRNRRMYWEDYYTQLSKLLKS